MSMHSSVAKLPQGPEESAAAAVVAGDLGTALTILMEGYGEELYRHCRQVLGDAELASDVHQTVFVQAYRDLVKFQSRSSFRTWLYAIARHRCLDALKKRKRWRMRFWLGSADQEVVDLAPNVRDMMESRGAAQAMDRALAVLTPEVRIAVLLRYREDMSFEEMAKVCGERPATLQARVARALPKLRRTLEKLGELS